ncbi:hypothetical protein AB8O53_35615, partial [Streptomyces pilosus]
APPRGAAPRRRQPPGERGLARAGVPVDADEADRAAGGGEAADAGGEVVDGWSPGDWGGRLTAAL